MAVTMWSLAYLYTILFSLTRAEPSFPSGSPRACLVGNKPILYEVLPGTGWDNLRNTESVPLVRYNFSLCQTTDDGTYLVPNDVYTIPIKSSKLDTFTELFNNWREYTSITATTVNMNTGIAIGNTMLSGKFSRETEKIRSKQSLVHSVTTQVQLRYNRYTAKLQPETPLHENFKASLLQIAYYIQLNKTEMARHQSQLLVRNFGTHVLTSLDAGATLVQTNGVKTSFVASYSADMGKVLAAISATFKANFKLDMQSSVDVRTLKYMIDQYIGNITFSEVETYGGPMFKASNFSLNDWIDGVDENLVAIDRSGDPIYYLITLKNLPELPNNIVYQLQKSVKEAVLAYYKYNTYYGCTKAESPNFSFEANVDDGSCGSSTNNYTFGGVYQTCQSDGHSVSINLCGILEQKNPQTGQLSCPSEYNSVFLDRGVLKYSETRRHCKRCYLASTCCKDVVVTGDFRFSSYWCAAKGDVPVGSGYLFGGVYTSTTSNLITRSFSCPMYFYPLRLGKTMRVCVSDDYELGYKHSVPFAGFFSCSAGNPLKLISETAHQQKRSTENKRLLESYIMDSGKDNYPRGCPYGYSEHLATISNGCEINYCIQTGALSGRSFPTIKRPPFIEIPSSGFADNDSTVVSEDGLIWKNIEEVSTNDSGRDKQSAESGLSTGAVVVVVVVITLSCVVIITVVVVMKKRLKNATSRYHRQESTNLLPNKHVHYGSEETGINTVM